MDNPVKCINVQTYMDNPMKCINVQTYMNNPVICINVQTYMDNPVKGLNCTSIHCLTIFAQFYRSLAKVLVEFKKT